MSHPNQPFPFFQVRVWRTYSLFYPKEFTLVLLTSPYEILKKTKYHVIGISVNNPQTKLVAMLYLISVALFSLPFSILISVEDDCMLQKFKARIDVKSNIICAGQKVYWKSIIGASERRALDNEFGSLWNSVDWERKWYCLKLIANCKYFGLIHNYCR